MQLSECLWRSCAVGFPRALSRQGEHSYASTGSSSVFEGKVLMIGAGKTSFVDVLGKEVQLQKRP